MSTALDRTTGERSARFQAGPLYRLTVKQYLKMIRTGIPTVEDKVELLEGVIVAKTGKNAPHFLVAKLILDVLYRILPVGWHAAKEDPFRTGDSVPEPDCLVIRDYAKRHLGATDLALVVEVANTSLGRDRGRKRRIYARAGMPFYWIANLQANQLEVYSDPTGPADEPAYRQVQILGPDDEVPVILDGREVGRIAVRDILP